MELAVENLGLIDYEAARTIQQARVEARVAGLIPDTLLLLEHPPVITLGRGTDPGNLLAAAGLPVAAVERGGDVTLHAPGQIVGYLIRLLPEGRRDLRAHLRLLEEIVIQAVARFGVCAGRSPGRTGVWVEDRKIASLGIACRNWCTWHGFALNVGIDLRLFAAIRPCGFDAGVMTSLDRETGRSHDLAAVRDVLAGAARALLAAGPGIVDPPGGRS